MDGERELTFFFFILQEDASNITILGLLLECTIPKSLFNNPRVCKALLVQHWYNGKE